MITDILNALAHSLESGLFVDEIMHGVVTLPFVLLLYYKTKSIRFSLVPLFVTYLIDMDHWVDYYLYYGNHISLTKFLELDYFTFSGRAIVPLHAWEWMLCFSALAYEQKKWKSVYVGIALGMLAHLIWDSHTVGSVAFYSILYRAGSGFMLIQ